MSLVRKDPPEGPPREAKIDPKSKKCMIFLRSKHGHFLRRLQDLFFVCFGPSRGSKSMDFRVPERLPGCFLWFYAHMQILSPLPCFFNVFQGVRTSKIKEKSRNFFQIQGRFKEEMDNILLIFALYLTHFRVKNIRKQYLLSWCILWGYGQICDQFVTKFVTSFASTSYANCVEFTTLWTKGGVGDLKFRAYH